MPTSRAWSFLVVGILGAAAPAEAQVPKELDRELIVRTLGAGPHLGPVDVCGDLTGQFGTAVRFRVAPDGRVDGVDVATTEPRFARCVADHLRRIRFPVTRDGGTFGYEYRFRGVYPTVVARLAPPGTVAADPCEPVGALVGRALYDEALALLARTPACTGDRDRVVQRALAKACAERDAARAKAYALQVDEVWLAPMYACRDAGIALPKPPPTGSLHVAHGRGHEWLEVTIDGEPYGAPPINANHLRAGRHEVEIWDSRTDQTRRATVTVPAGGHLHLDDHLVRVRRR
jgi:hypothetical protein